VFYLNFINTPISTTISNLNWNLVSALAIFYGVTTHKIY